MPSFLDKLEQLAGQWLNTVEAQAQPIVVQIVTGAVFTQPTQPEEEFVELQTLYSEVTYQESPHDRNA